MDPEEGRMLASNRVARGATHLGFVDILTAVILLGILLWAATLQFPAYERSPVATTPTGTSASK